LTDLLRWGSLSFPETQSTWGRKHGAFAVMLRHRRIAALGTAAVVGIASTGYFAVGYIRYQRLVAADAAAISRTASANADLQDALARLRDELGAANQALNTAKSRVGALNEEAHRQLASSEATVVSKGDRIAQLTHALEQAQRELHLAEAQHATLLARLSKAETDVSEGQQRHQQAQAGLEQWQKKIQQLTTERDRAAGERDQLRARVGQLEKQSLSQTHQPAAVAAAPVPVAPATAAAASPAPAVAATTAAPAAVAPPPPKVAAVVVPRAVPAVAEVGSNHGALAQFERVLASAGVDVEHLFADFGVARGLGGPFVPVPRSGMPENRFSAAKLAALPGLAKALPLAIPMSNYRETSPFGQRTDPFNGRLAFHPGIDLAAPYGTPVYATAPGVVTYAGYRSDYGKIVEIDHGHGIVTRYSHLARYVVLVGQRVAAGAHIGYEGSTGRSTGPHLLYEVDVNGEPQDPQKFMSLGRLMRLAQR
jgi:murein DD-endopeptidase MepM/ murein hydrolase activator NlpD